MAHNSIQGTQFRVPVMAKTNDQRQELSFSVVVYSEDSKSESLESRISALRLLSSPRVLSRMSDLSSKAVSHSRPFPLVKGPVMGLPRGVFGSLVITPFFPPCCMVPALQSSWHTQAPEHLLVPTLCSSGASGWGWGRVMPSNLATQRTPLAVSGMYLQIPF